MVNSWAPIGAQCPRWQAAVCWAQGSQTQTLWHEVSMKDLCELLELKGMELPHKSEKEHLSSDQNGPRKVFSTLPGPLSPLGFLNNSRKGNSE